MHMQLIRNIAQENGIKAGRMSKVNLVRAIQRTEGNLECFATDVDGTCDQTECLWRDDCTASAKKAKAS
ncbi:MAG: SAP domain-containing protein [Gammaproteobacteria bacterium]|nr:SAP domain-containing protein [Gammaproteobacteria bacterium]